MFNRNSTLTKFIALTLGLFVILSIALFLASRLIIEKAYTRQAADQVNVVIAKESLSLLPADFSQKDPARTKSVFDQLFSNIKTQDMVRIKVWDYSAKIIYSNDQSLIGQRFADNPGFQNSIKGKLFTNIEKPTKSENEAEKNFSQLLEVYVPFRFSGESNPSGVIEVYFKMDNVNAQIHQTQIILSISIGTFSLLAAVLLVILFRSVILKQLEQINLQALALDNASDHVIITDTDGFILYVNEQAENMTGYSRKELIGQRPSLWGGQMPKEFYEKMWHTIKFDKQIFSGEITNKRKNGETYQADASITPVLDNNNEVRFFVGIEHDITTRKLAEKKIIEEKSRLESILENIGEGVVAIDSQRKVLLLNKIGEQLLGWKEVNLIGKVINDLPLVDAEGQPVPLEKRPTYVSVTTGKNVYTNNYYFVRKDRSTFPIGITIAPIILNDKVLGAIGVFRDITKEKEVDKAKTEFVSLASHQLRTPLSAIKWYTEMLIAGDAGKLSAEQEKYLGEIYHGNQRMVELVNALLNVSRIEIGTLLVEPEPTNITLLVQNVIDEQKAQIDEKKIEVSFIPEKDIPLMQADPKLLRMVVQNLLSNAVKYTPEAGKIEISLSLNDKQEVTLKVADTGYGIPNNQQDKIFTKLFRADNAREKDTEGTGLGLYIVKSIVDNSGGQIRFESQENKGTTFYVTLPTTGMKKKEGTKALE